MNHCAVPPPIKTLNVLEVGETFATLQWNTSARPLATSADLSTRIYESVRLKYADQFSYSLSWQTQEYQWTTGWPSRDAYQWNQASNIVLPSDQMTIVLAGLVPKTRYFLSIFAFNDCAQTAKLALQIATRDHGAVQRETRFVPSTRLLPHESILVLIALIVWIVILHRFFQIYKKITCVNVLPTTVYSVDGREEKFTDSADRRRSSGSQQVGSHKMSNVSGVLFSQNEESFVSKMSTAATSKFELLEDAVCMWRSETILSTKLTRDHSTHSSTNAPIRETSTSPLNKISCVSTPFDRIQGGTTEDYRNGHRNSRHDHHRNSAHALLNNSLKNTYGPRSSITTLAGYPIPKVMIEHETAETGNDSRRNSVCSQLSAKSAQLPVQYIRRSSASSTSRFRYSSSNEFISPEKTPVNPPPLEEDTGSLILIPQSLPMIRKATILLEPEKPTLSEQESMSKAYKAASKDTMYMQNPNKLARQNSSDSNSSMIMNHVVIKPSTSTVTGGNDTTTDRSRGRRRSNYALRMYSTDDSPVRRKISDVLLGKATKDIRRYSTFETNKNDIARLRQLTEQSSTFRRRLYSISSALPRRFSLKRREHRNIASEMDCLREEHEYSPTNKS